jgi:hypothetical protein
MGVASYIHIFTPISPYLWTDASRNAIDFCGFGSSIGSQRGLNLAKPKILANQDWGPGHMLQRYALMHVEGERPIWVHVMPLQRR